MTFYIGPDQFLPVSSFLGAAAGAIMLYRRKFMENLRKALQLLRRR